MWTRLCISSSPILVILFSAFKGSFCCFVCLFLVLFSVFLFIVFFFVVAYPPVGDLAVEEDGLQRGLDDGRL